tara:strand:- start:53 stop:238 length:186 start_codon:yes stop_codon:yes gene_type:complete
MKVTKKFADQLGNADIHYNRSGYMKVIVTLEDGTYLSLYQMNDPSKKRRNYHQFSGEKNNG